MNIRALTIESFGKGLRSGEYSAREVAQAYLSAIEKQDPEIRAYLRVTRDDALRAADAVDARLARGEQLAPLAGVPIALKDNMLVEGGIASAGSKILAEYRASYDATVVAKLKASHAVILGKTNLDEFAMGSSTENSGFFPTKNPHALDRVPGGSSGGSAAAVAGGMAIAALGSDTGGSIRQPAAFCGVVGMKPTYGAVSRFGLIAMASSLDQIGPLTRTVRDAALLFDAIRGHDPFDATSVNYAYESPAADIGEGRKFTIGVPKEFFASGIDPAVAQGVAEAMARLGELGCVFKEISLPHAKHALAVYYLVMPAEVSTNLARFDGVRYGRASGGVTTLRDVYFETRGRGFGAEPRRRILLGTFALSAGYYDAYYAKAQKVRRLISEDFDAAFDAARGGVDMIIGPVTPTPAFSFGEKTGDPLTMYLSDIYTVPVNLAGLPAISIPVKQYAPGSGELPIGFQLIGRRFRENDLFAVGERYERT
jgi:aspartyl-tRNA(Asn)/glutamyl-tRNA(Gln) amidotransferase subunit A